MSFREDHPEFFWFLIIMIGIFLLWVLSGGPEQSAPTRNNKFIEPLAPLGGGNTYDENFIETDVNGRILNPIVQ